MEGRNADPEVPDGLSEIRSRLRPRSVCDLRPLTPDPDNGLLTATTLGSVSTTHAHDAFAEPVWLRKLYERVRTGRQSVYRADGDDLGPVLAPPVAIGRKVTDNSSDDALASLRSRELAAVAFVRDYVQLDFDGPRLTVLNLPHVTEGGATWPPHSPGWRDTLCARIGGTVTDAAVTVGIGATLVFSDGARIVVPLGPADYRSREGLILEDSSDGSWTGW